MVKARQGSIMFTGATAALRGSAKFALLACPKFALRALAQSMAREFQPQARLSIQIRLICLASAMLLLLD